MGSKFARYMRHKRKPAVCKAPRPPGPVDPAWPPKAGEGLCIWQGPWPGGPDFHVGDVALFTWLPAGTEYYACFHQKTDRVEVRVTLSVDHKRWAVYYEYWQSGVYKKAGYSYHPAGAPGHPVLLEADFYIRPQLTHRIVFRLSAFPLV